MDPEQQLEIDADILMADYKGVPVMGPPADAYYRGPKANNRCLDCSQFHRRPAPKVPGVRGRCTVDFNVGGPAWYVDGLLSCPWFTRASEAHKLANLLYHDPKTEGVPAAKHVIPYNLEPPYLDESYAQTLPGGASLEYKPDVIFEMETSPVKAKQLAKTLMHGAAYGMGPVPAADHIKTEIKWAGVDFGKKAYSMGPSMFNELFKAEWAYDDPTKKWKPPAGKHYQQAYTYGPNGEIKASKVDIVDAAGGDDYYEAYAYGEPVFTPSPILKELMEKAAIDMAAKIDEDLLKGLSGFLNEPVSFSIGGKVMPPKMVGGKTKHALEASVGKTVMVGPAINVQVEAKSSDEMAKVVKAIQDDINKNQAFYAGLGMKATKFKY